MVIKKQGKALLIDSQNDELVIENDQAIKLSFTEGKMVIDKPGEYEVSDVAVLATEISATDYVARINFLSLNVEGIDVGIMFEDVTTDKETLKDIANLDIIIVSKDVSVDTVKKLVTYFEPQNLIILTKMTDEEVKKAYNFINVTSEKQLKYKYSDFVRGETPILTTTLLPE